MNFDISSMLDPDVYDHPVAGVELIETHISWVLLTGNFAYKIKKPVDFGFLDFSTLEKRRRCCEQELNLNRRLAPSLYLDVVPVSGTYNKPVISGSGEAFEYAVKMVQFQQSAQLDHMLAAGELNVEHIDAIARMIARFHQTIQVADDSTDFGSKETVHQPVKENFTQIAEHLDTRSYADTLSQLKQWSESEFLKLQSLLEQRKRDGFVRECHGDMHLRNLVWLDDGPTAFDCIEFNAELRWIDVISEVAFLLMDLQDRQQGRLANRFLNTYLEVTGDYAGLPVLPFYLCYRAMVRAKVDALRLEQKDVADEERKSSLAEFESYLELATGYTSRSMPKLIIMRGVSASGKSFISQKMLDVNKVIRIRSDVERKRLFDIESSESATSEIAIDKIEAGLYSKQASKKTYARLTELATHAINSGFSVIVDAAFLKHEQRTLFQTLAESLGAPYVIVEATAPEEVLRQRIVERKSDVSDADLAVLEHQLLNWQPLHEDESAYVITINTGESLDLAALMDRVNAV